MTRLSIRIASVVLVLLFAASAVHAADSCLAPCLKVPKKTRHVSTAVALPNGPLAGLLLTTPGATLAKGKKKNVIVVEATMISGIPAALPMVLSMAAVVNGVLMEPTGNPWGVATDCGGTPMSPLPLMLNCTLSATFWLDLDQAETASPGTFIGKPLTVKLNGGDVAALGIAQPVFVSMAVRQEAK